MGKVKNNLKRIISIILVLAFAVSLGLTSGKETQAASYNGVRTLTMNQARSLAIYNSTAIEKIDMQLDAKQAALKSAIKSIKVKKKNLSTFRWKPLLKFKFPSQPDMQEAFEFSFKPVQLQYEVDKIEHKKKDAELTEAETINSLFVDIIVLQDTIKFSESRMKILEETIAKTEPKVLAGDATQKDLDSMKKSFEKLKSSVATSERKLLTAKQKLSNKIKVDVTGDSYKFEDPMVENDVTMDMKDMLFQYAKDRDDVYYEKRMDEIVARLSVETNYSLLRGHYSSKYIRMISPYIDAALRGDEFNQREFTKAYQNFVERVNEKWNGYKKILFFKFRRDRTQGELDGDRYFQDDPMVMLTAVTEYKEARLEREQTEKELYQNIEDALGTYLDVRTTYRKTISDLEKAEQDLEKATIANKSGILDYSSFKAVSDSYEELQNTLLETAKLYSETLYSLDRLTCGALTDYFKDLTIDLREAPGGESYVDTEYINGVSYFIRPIIQETQFQIGINIPDDFEMELSDFEVWINGTLIQKRTPVDKVVRHMAFDLQDVDDCFIRFYNGDEFVDDVRFDAGSYNGPLEIVKAYHVIEQERLLGNYEVTNFEDQRPSVMSINISETEQVKYYRVKDENGTYLLSDKIRDITTKFPYHEFIKKSMNDLVFEFYDADQNLLYEGHADPVTHKIYKLKEEITG